MAMTVLVTRDVEDRYRGFLLSCMVEIAPGIYLSPDMTKGVRERIWDIVVKWHSTLGRGSITLVFPDAACPSGLGIWNVGTPRRDIVDFDGFLGVRLHDSAQDL